MTRTTRSERLLFTLCLGFSIAGPIAAVDGDFLGRGITAFDLGGSDGDSASAVVVQADGRVVVAGTATTGAASRTLALARFLPDGSLDSSFGAGGKVVNPFGEANNLSGVALHLLPDGRLLVACTYDYGTADQDFYVGRLLENGAPDNAFGGGGYGAILVPFDIGGDLTDTLSAMTVDRNGRILLAGAVDVSASDIDFGLVRLTSAGLLDTEFSGDGKQTVDVAGAADLALAIAYANSGIVVAGATWSTELGGNFDVALARLAFDGSLDGGFGTGGTAVWSWNSGGTYNDIAWALGVWPDGEIVVAADIATGTATWQWMVRRFATDGAPLDGVTGTFCGTLLPPCSASPQDSPRALFLQGDGKIVIAGFGLNSSGDSDFGVARMTRTLSSDTTFGGGDGTTTYDFGAYGGVADSGLAMAFDRDGRIVVSGATEWSGFDTDFAWARFDSSYVFADGFDWPGGWARWSATAP